MKKRVAICPRCEAFYELTPNQVEAWCQHLSSIPALDGDPDAHIEKYVIKVRCKIVEVGEE